jgi:tetratricopeptide (TPR) repeat protein
VESPAGFRFGELLEQLREQAGETQRDFARRFSISRELYGMIKAGERRPSDQLRARALKLFPNERAEIEARYADVQAERLERQQLRTQARAAIDRDLERHLLDLVRVNRTSEAKRDIQRALAADLEPAKRLWLLGKLADLEAAEGGTAAVATLREAVDLASEAGLRENETATRLRLARILLRASQHDQAHEVVDEGLKRHPRDGDLWLRKGIIHWYQHHFADALACLTAAETCGVPEDQLVHPRGCVLAIWGNYETAIGDLTRSMEVSPTEARAAYARSTRAYCLFNLGQPDEALAEFALAEAVTPENSHLHYFLALCYARAGDHEKAIEQLKTALEVKVPALGRAKEEHVLQLMRDYGIDVSGMRSRARPA